jgi:hypothetical protein
VSERLKGFYVNYGDGSCIVTTLGSMLSAVHNKPVFLGTTAAGWTYIKQWRLGYGAFEKLGTNDPSDKQRAHAMALVYRSNSSLICGLINRLTQNKIPLGRHFKQVDIRYARAFSFDQLRQFGQQGHETGILSEHFIKQESHMLHVSFEGDHAYDVSTQNSPRLLSAEEIRHHEIAMNEFSEISNSFNTILMRHKTQ